MPRRIEYTSPASMKPLIMRAVRASGLLEELKVHEREYFERRAEEFETDQPHETNDFSLEVERFWGCNASLSFNFRSAGSERGQGDEADQVIFTYKPEVRIGWSSTGRTPVQALAAVDLYNKVALLGATLEGMCAGVMFGRSIPVYG